MSKQNILECTLEDKTVDEYSLSTIASDRCNGQCSLSRGHRIAACSPEQHRTPRSASCRAAAPAGTTALQCSRALGS